MKDIRKNDTEMVAHARRELELAGLFTAKEAEDYDGFIGKGALALIKLFDEWSKNDPHRMSAIGSVFNYLIAGELLSPPTNDPEEWEDYEVEGQLVRRNKRSIYFITRDNGDTWFNLRTEQKGICNDKETGKPVEGVEDPNGKVQTENQKSATNPDDGGYGVNPESATKNEAVADKSEKVEKGKLDTRVEPKGGADSGKKKTPTKKSKKREA